MAKRVQPLLYVIEEEYYISNWFVTKYYDMQNFYLKGIQLNPTRSAA